MADNKAEMRAEMSVIVPASNEEDLIVSCLQALLMSDWTRPAPVEVIVLANGCRDATVAAALAQAAGFAARGWSLIVEDRAEGGKIGALNQADGLASGAMRVYLDADVTLSPPLLAQIAESLDTAAPRYASGAVQIIAQGAVSRAYARFWARVPFMRAGVPGCGLFAVNAAGRARWDTFPDIISDDTYVRLLFTPSERLGTPAPYLWPIAEGFGRLVRVRRRQDAGVDEIAARYPELLANDDKAAFPKRDVLRLALRDPLAFGVYTAVAIAVRVTRALGIGDTGWSRGR